MAGRIQQDTFMDDSDDACPLCVEEFDLSDKNFRPCPCGYQVCQFCYNNIKNNMNGLCPACRRPYNDENIEWKIVSPEEFKADLQSQAKKKAVARQKEVERRQVETLNRKHLSGLRVVQKNLVYVVGLNPKIREEDLLQTLRGEQYFGQYGKIVKIVVSKAKESSSNNPSIGVYVTFARKQDAASCIAAVDGSQNGDRILRAQHGTTKYCSAFLRNENCNNKGCMFLHETGENDDSFSRQDLSSINAVSSQQPVASSSAVPTSKAGHHQSSQPPVPQALQNIPAAQEVQSVKAEAMSRSDSGDGSALPTTASWAKNPQIEQSRQSSQSASRSTPSPRAASAKPVVPLPDSRNMRKDVKAAVKPETLPQPNSKLGAPLPQLRPTVTTSTTSDAILDPLEAAFKAVLSFDFKWSFDRSLYDQEMLSFIDNYPPLIDPNGGAIRCAMKLEQDQQRQKHDEDQTLLSSLPPSLNDDNMASGSLQLGGEPDTQDDLSNPNILGASRRILSQRAFGGMVNKIGAFDNQPSLGGDFPNLASNRTMTSQQQRSMSILKAPTHRNDSMLDQFHRAPSGNASLHQPQLSNPFQSQNPQLSTLSTHGRQASRYAFANDANGAAGNKPASNAQIMAQQSAMMPSTQAKPFQPNQHSGLQSNFYSGVQGPPPGLKSTGTPPISGGGMFGQGHGFASAMGGNLGFGGNLGPKNSNDDLMQSFVRGKAAGAAGISGAETGKRGTVDLTDPSILQARVHHGGLGQNPFGANQGQGGYNSHNMMYGGVLLGQLLHATPASLSAFGTKRISIPSNGASSRDASEGSQNPPGFSSTTEFPPLAPIAKPSLDISRPGTPLTKTQHGGLQTHARAAIPLPSLASQARVFSDKTSERPLRKVVPPEVTEESIIVNPMALSLLSSSPAVLSEEKAAQQDQERRATSSVSSPVSENAPRNAGPKSALKEAITQAKPNAPPDGTESEKATIVQITAELTGIAMKRQRPSQLDITGAREAAKEEFRIEADSVTSSQAGPHGVESQVTAVGTPGTANSQITISSEPRPKYPRTIRLLPMPKSELSPSSSSAVPPSGASSAPLKSAGLKKHPSRQASISSINLPGTPVQDRLSETASLASTSMSRATSPHPGKVPAKGKTKSQQKKERQSRSRQADDAVQTPPFAVEIAIEAAIQAPILGRKKKARKAVTPTALPLTIKTSRAASPRSKEPVTKPSEPGEDRSTKETNIKPDVASEPQTPNTPDITPKPVLTAADVFQELQAAGELSSNPLHLFKGPPPATFREEIALTPDLFADPPTLTEEESKLVRQGGLEACIAIEAGPDSFVVVIAGGNVLRGFTRAEAESYIALRRRVLTDKSAAAFSSSRHPIHQWAFCTSADELLREYERGGKSSHDGDEVMNEYASQMMRDDETLVVPFGADAARLVAPGDELLTHDLVLGLEEAEHRLLVLRKEQEVLEKKLAASLKKNRKLLLGHA